MRLSASLRRLFRRSRPRRASVPSIASIPTTPLASSPSWRNRSLPSPWFYTGGLENHPDCVEQISRRHALWGIDAETLRAVRDPRRVADVLARNGIPCPEVRSDPRGLPRDAKLAEEAAGLGRRTRHRAADGPKRRRLARRIISRNGSTAPASRHFSSASDRSAAHLIGVTRQLIGIEGSPFGYLGSIGPVPIDRAAGLPA